MNTKVLFINCLLGGGIAFAQNPASTPLEWGEAGRRFELKMNGTHERTSSRLDQQTFLIKDQNGHESSREEINREDLKSENDLFKRVYYESMFQVDLGYRVWNNLKVWVGIGVAQLGEKTTITESGTKIQNTVSETIIPTYKVGLSYTYLIRPRLFLHIAPSVRFLQTKALMYDNEYNAEGMIDPNDVSQKITNTAVEVPLSVGYAFGKVIPRIGVMYRDCFIRSSYSFQKQYIGEMYRVENINKLSSSDKIRGFAACDFQFARNLSLGASASVGKTYSVQLALTVSL